MAEFKLEKSVEQQEYLRAASAALGITQKELAARLGTPWPTFAKWLLPKDSKNARGMSQTALAHVNEVLEHEALKKKLAKKGPP